TVRASACRQSAVAPSAQRRAVSSNVGDWKTEFGKTGSPAGRWRAISATAPGSVRTAGQTVGLASRARATSDPGPGGTQVRPIADSPGSDALTADTPTSLSGVGPDTRTETRD